MASATRGVSHYIVAQQLRFASIRARGVIIIIITGTSLRCEDFIAFFKLEFTIFIQELIVVHLVTFE
jgi:hypothetical protein